MLWEVADRRKDNQFRMYCKDGTLGNMSIKREMEMLLYLPFLLKSIKSGMTGMQIIYFTIDFSFSFMFPGKNGLYTANAFA